MVEAHQWQFNGVDLPNATGSQLTLTNVLPEQAGTYTVIVNSPVGTETRSATLSVTGSLRIREQPSSQTVLSGTTVTFEAQVDGVAPISYQWRFNDHDVPGETNSSLVLTNVWLDRSGNYSVNVSNSYTNLQSSNAVLEVETLRIIGPPQDQNPYRRANVAFGVAAEGLGPFAYQWQFNGTVLTGATGSALALTNVQFAQSGIYSVIVSNAFTNLIASANLSVGQLANWNYPYEDMANVSGLTNLIAIATGGYHNIVLRSDGTVMVWGLNNGGVPIEATNVIAIAAAGDRNLALRADGTLVSWGSYADGQFGFPSGTSNIVAIACGDSQNLA